MVLPSQAATIILIVVFSRVGSFLLFALSDVFHTIVMSFLLSPFQIFFKLFTQSILLLFLHFLVFLSITSIPVDGRCRVCRIVPMLQPQRIATDSHNESQIGGEYSQLICNSHSSASVTVQRKTVIIIDLVPPIEDVNEAQWTSEWLKSSSSDIETQIFKGIDACWPTESELTGCLGVVITGSTCSCVNDYPHTEQLFAFFKTVIHLEIPVLAICYSAQMLVRWLVGKENVIRLAEPHIGFVRIEFPADESGSGWIADFFECIV
jgi:hypothetical protein